MTMMRSIGCAATSDIRSISNSSPAKAFVGLGAGDVEALAFVAQANHLFIKPKAIERAHQPDRVDDAPQLPLRLHAAAAQPDPDHLDVIYVLRFLYSKSMSPEPAPAPSADSALAQAPATRVRQCRLLVLRPRNAATLGGLGRRRAHASSIRPAGGIAGAVRPQ